MAEKTWAHRRLPGIAAALVPAIAAVAAASPAAAAGHAPAVISASHPPGYQIVSSGLVNAPPGTFDSGTSVACPAGTVAWGGGVLFSGVSANANLNVNTSNPNGSSGWAARVNNTGATTEQFAVDAVCAKKPAGYKLVSQEVDNPPGSQSHSTATCPSPDVLLGGGTLSTSDQVGAILTSAWPASPAKFTGYLYNGTATDAQFAVYAICGHKPADYKIASGSATVDPGFTLDDGIGCPPGTSDLDGGAQVPGHVPAVQVGGSSDDGAGGWFIEVVNTGQSAEQANAYAICAA